MGAIALESANKRPPTTTRGQGQPYQYPRGLCAKKREVSLTGNLVPLGLGRKESRTERITSYSEGLKRAGSRSKLLPRATVQPDRHCVFKGSRERSASDRIVQHCAESPEIQATCGEDSSRLELVGQALSLGRRSTIPGTKHQGPSDSRTRAYARSESSFVVKPDVSTIQGYPPDQGHYASFRYRTSKRLSNGRIWQSLLRGDRESRSS